MTLYKTGGLLRLVAPLGIVFLLGGPMSALAAEDGKAKAETAKKVPGEAEMIKLTPAEALIFEMNHMSNVPNGKMLKYEFERKGQLGDDFSDTVTLQVSKGESTDAKTVVTEFFTGERRRPYPTFSYVKANPLLTVFFNKDAWSLARRIKAKGTANYLRNRIIDGVHQVKKLEEASCEVDGKSEPAKSLTFSPFLEDKNRHHLVHYHALTYRVVISEAVPGGLCLIESVIPAQKEGVPDHYIARLKKQGMRDLASEAIKVNKVKDSGAAVITERLKFVGMADGKQAHADKVEVK